jgi:hypothetical protein
MTTTITHLAAQERINHQLREAQRARRAREPRHPRRTSLAVPQRLLNRRTRVTGGLTAARIRSTQPHKQEVVMSIKLKLIALVTTIATVTLPAADALANRNW